MKRLLNYMRKNIWYYAVAVTAMITSIALDMFDPYLRKLIVDDVIEKNNMDIFKYILLGMLGITLGRAVLGYIKEYFFDLSSSKIVVELRRDLFEHIQTLSFSFFDRTNTGELMSRIKEDTDNVLHATAFGIMLFSEQMIYFVVASAMLFTLSWKLAIVCLVTMPIIAWLAIKLEKHIGETFGKLSDQRAAMNTVAQENIAGIRLVKAFGRERHEIQKFLKQNNVYYELGVEQAGVFARFHPKIEFLSNIVIVLVTAVGGFLVIGDEMTIGTLVAFSTYIYMLIWPMRLIGWLMGVLAQCKTSLEKIENIFKEKPDIKSPERPKHPHKTEGHIVFENVSLEYNGVKVLDNINIDAKPGSTIAVMGMTGSGKSSIISLIGRYYDVSAGTVYFDGVDVREMDLNELRQEISVVMQDTFLFSDTIEENIRFGQQNASNEELIAASVDARVNDFVMKMPEGYKTIIGERGIGLSGGQKQRISIARALVKNSKVLILDDATSALDMETEHEIQQAIEKRKGLTKFIIAHRVSAVKNADEIIIIEDGKIVERGNHNTLLELKGRYYETYCQQFQGMMFGYEEEQEEVV